MAKYRFQGALNAATFPLLSLLQPRTVLDNKLDSNVRTPESFYGTKESANFGVPQILYAENIVPTAEGVMSCGYNNIVPPTSFSDFDQVITLRDVDENNYLFAPAAGKNYIYTGNKPTWRSINPIDASGRAVSRAYVNGRTFVCYENLGIYEYNALADTFTLQVVTGLANTDIRGIGASNNYLIAYTDITVYWSSLINPLDFLPSINTGAGFAIPQDVKAKITAVTGTAGGFIIYTAKNAVAAVYSQNIRAPFNFKEIANAGGVSSYEQTTSDQNSGPQYTWGTSGFQKVTTQQAEPLSAELNDFLAGKVYETWDAVNKRIVPQTADSYEFQVKVTYIASRYLIISYGLLNSGNYEYALLYDTALKRWGKLKITHVDCFQYPYPNVTGDLSYDELGNTSYEDLGDTSYAGLAFGIKSTQPSKRTIAFLNAQGAIFILEADYAKADQAGIVVLGKFQLTRSRLMTIQQLDLEAIYGTNDVQVTAISSIEGKELDYKNPMKLLKDGQFLHKYARRQTGTNISIAIEGAFSLTSYILEVQNDGDR